MIDLPSEIVTGPFHYQITQDADECKKAGVFKDGFYAGQTQHNDHKILLAAGLAPDEFKDTVLHEWLHTIWRTFHLPPGDDRKEEEIIKRLSTVLLDGMRRNPQLVAFLMEAT